MSEPVKMWRYVLPSENGEGWAVIHMDSRGFFATCSDYGNYAYHWSSWGEGKDFREFMMRMERDYDYFGNKLNRYKWHQQSDKLTVKNIKRHIIECRMEGCLNKEEARDHWEYLREYERGDIDFREWVQEQELFEDWSEAADCGSTEPSADIWCFCTKTLPRLCKLLQAELEAEAALENGSLPKP